MHSPHLHVNLNSRSSLHSSLTGGQPNASVSVHSSSLGHSVSNGGQTQSRWRKVVAFIQALASHIFSFIGALFAKFARPRREGIWPDLRDEVARIPPRLSPVSPQNSIPFEGLPPPLPPFPGRSSENSGPRLPVTPRLPTFDPRERVLGRESGQSRPITISAPGLQNATGLTNPLTSSEAFDVLQPRLLTHVLESNHPLSSEAFLLFPEERKKEREGALEEQYLPSYYDLEDYQRNIQEFRKFSLVGWIKSQGKYGLTLAGETELSRELLNQRVQQVDEAIQIRDRIQALKTLLSKQEQAFLYDLEMQDLEAPWQESALKIALMSQEEFESLTLEQIETLSPRQLKLAKSRFEATSKPLELEINEEEMGIANLKQLTLSQFQSISPAKFASLVEHLPRSVLPFVAKEQMRGLDLTQLSPEVFTALFSGPDESQPSHVQELELDQIYAAFDRFDASCLSHLSDGQIAEFDFAWYELSQEQFEGLFSSDRKVASQTYNRVRSLSTDQLYALWDKFDDRLGYISQEQLKQLDFEDHPLTQEQFDGLFYPSEINKNLVERLQHTRVKELSQEQLYACLTHFDAKRMFCLSDEQIEQFDFVEHPLTQEQFEGLFSSNRQVVNKTYNRVRLLSTDQLYALWDKFDDRLGYISQEQLKQLDFEDHPLTQEQFDGLFYPAEINENGMERLQHTRVKELSQEQLYACLDLFDAKRMFCLSDKQIEQFDFEWHALTQEQFEGLFSSNRQVVNKTYNRVRLLSTDQLYALWDKFDDRLGYISQEQLKQLDFEEHPLTEKQFDGLFYPSEINKNLVERLHQTRVKELSQEQLYACLDLFDAKRMFCLSDEQIEQFDFVEHPLTQEQFEGLFSSNRQVVSRTYNRVRLLSMDQLYALWDKFDDRLGYISQEQLEQLDFAAHPLTEKQFDGLFPVYSSNLGRDLDLSNSLVQKLSQSQLHQCLAWFDATRLDYISPEQVAHLNFEAYNLQERRKLVEGLFSFTSSTSNQRVRAANRFNQLSGQTINSLWSELPLSILDYIDSRQLRDLSFINITKQQFDEMFYERQGSYMYGVDKVPEHVQKRLGFLSRAQQRVIQSRVGFPAWCARFLK